jgi:hypothetical protein
LQSLDGNKYINENVKIIPGKATSRMSSQSMAHLLMVLLIIFGNISYYYKMKEKE